MSSEGLKIQETIALTEELERLKNNVGILAAFKEALENNTEVQSSD